MNTLRAFVLGLTLVATLGLSRWVLFRQLTWVVAGTCTVLIILGYFYSPPGVSFDVAVTNRSLGDLPEPCLEHVGLGKGGSFPPPPSSAPPAWRAGKCLMGAMPSRSMRRRAASNSAWYLSTKSDKRIPDGCVLI